MASASYSLATLLYTLWIIFASLFFIVLIAADTWLLPHLCSLRFPRDAIELMRPQHRAWLIGVVQRAARLAWVPDIVDVRRLGGLESEPDKNATAAGFAVRYRAPTPEAAAGGGNATDSDGEGSVHLFVKWNCGRGFPLWLQAVRAAAECGVAREADAYRRILSLGGGGAGSCASASGGVSPPLLPRTPRCVHVDALPWRNRVVLVLEHFDVCAAGAGAGARARPGAEADKGAAAISNSDGGAGGGALAGSTRMYQLADHDGCPAGAAAAVLSAAARLHAAFLAPAAALGCGRVSGAPIQDAVHERASALAWLPSARGPRGGLQYYNFVYEFVKRKEGAALAPLWQALCDYFERAGAAAAPTLVHGDCRVGNMLFAVPPSSLLHPGALRPGQHGETADAAPSCEPDRVTFTDWEAVNVAPALWDFTYLTTISLSPAQCEESQDDLLRGYLAALHRHADAAGRGGGGGARLPTLREARQQVVLLTLVLHFVAKLVVEQKVWDGHGNTAADSEAWQSRIAAAVARVDARAAAGALGVAEADVLVLQRQSSHSASADSSSPRQKVD
eukprot:g5710.t1